MPPAVITISGKHQIGAEDAWTEDEKKLLTIFIETPHFEQLKQHGHWFLFGRRGAGKSALAIASKNHGAWTFRHIVPGVPEETGVLCDLVSGMEARIDAGLRLDVKQFIERLWAYVIRIFILQIVYEKSKPDASEESEDGFALALIEEYLVEHEYFGMGIGEILYAVYIQAMDCVSERAKEDPTPVNQFLTGRLRDKKLRECIKQATELLKNRSLLIVLDSLETYDIFSPHNATMKHLLRAIVSAMTVSAWHQPVPNVGVWLLMPAEIHHEVLAEMPSKVARYSLFLCWGAHDLYLFLAKRYLAMLEKEGVLEGLALTNYKQLLDRAQRKDRGSIRDEFWYKNRFLPNQIVNDRGQEEDTLAYILRHTQRRPRQMIIIFNAILAVADGRKDVLTCISAESVVRGIHHPQCLSLLLEDALSPFSQQQDLVSLARTTFAGKCRVMKGHALKKTINAVYDVHAVGTENIDPETFLTYLFRAGVIGRVIKQEKKSNLLNTPYCIAEFEYLMRDKIAFNKDHMYCAHPVLGDCIGMDPSDDYGVVFPMPIEDGDF